jgi:hypothetical protein
MPRPFTSLCRPRFSEERLNTWRTDSENGALRNENERLSKMNLSDTRNENLCFVCAYPVEHRFCKIHRTEGGPMLICCPDCVDQYLDASRGPLEIEEQERGAFVNRLEMFIGVDKPWLAKTPIP